MFIATTTKQQLIQQLLLIFYGFPLKHWIQIHFWTKYNNSTDQNTFLPMDVQAIAFLSGL